MARLLILVAIVAVVYLLIRACRKKGAGPETPAVAEDMVRCAHCGVHLPNSESVREGDDCYCSAEHRDAHRN